MAYESTGPNAGRTTPGSSSPGDESGIGQTIESTASALGRSAASKADRARTRAASGLESAAQSVHAGTDQVASAGHSAGDALSSSARYVRDNDVSSMMDDVLDLVRDNPGYALLGAAALGFLVGRAITR
jgi:ElaB/YqjD/DUF883 family membrane-anchored ribosome-binding protein